MANTWFQFKKFRINQDRCAMKVSSDSVVLGAISGSGNPELILDVGAGTGVISLMLAQRFLEAKVIGIEIDKETATQCKENFQASPFSDRTSLVNKAFQDFDDFGPVDLIVSNPPYYPSHLKPNEEKREKALHTSYLSFGDLVQGVLKHLKESGEFWVILPPDQMKEMKRICLFFRLHPSDTYSISDRPGKRILREIICFTFQQREEKQHSIFYKEENGEANGVYKSLLADFFLDF